MMMGLMAVLQSFRTRTEGDPEELLRMFDKSSSHIRLLTYLNLVNRCRDSMRLQQLSETKIKG